MPCFARRTLKQRRRSSTFGLQSDSDDSDYDSDRSYASEVSESSVASSSSSGSFMYKSELEEQTQPCAYCFVAIAWELVSNSKGIFQEAISNTQFLKLL